MVSVLTIHSYGEAIIETSIAHYLFIQYPDNTYLSELQSSWKQENEP
jgi:predicted transcriptional regulator with HTH domain